MKVKLLIQALSKFLVGLALFMLLLFLPAGTWYYWNGWLFCGLLFLPILVLGAVLMIKAPDLLRKRLQGKETQSAQRQVVVLSFLMFVAGFITAGLDFRWGWSRIPAWVVVVSAVILLGSYGLYTEVMRENTYLSRTVEVQQGQTVIDTGLYGVVRHPMYMATMLLFLSFPLVLGSWFAFLIFLIYPLLLVRRIKNEEAVLEAGLPGYTAYQQKVKFRMIPFIW